MVYFDSEDPGLTGGIDRWRVRFVEDKVSSKGDRMFALKLVRVSNAEDELQAYVMLQGKGRFDGRKQLSAMVAPGFKGEVEAADLIGVTVWIETVVEEYKGRPSLKVKSRDSLLRCAGFQRGEEVPDGYVAPAESGWDAGSDPWDTAGAPPATDEGEIKF